MVESISFNIFFFTILLFCVFIAFSQWRLTKDATILWYIGYLLATFAHYGRQFWLNAADGFRLPYPPNPPLRWDSVLSYAGFACYLLFVERLMNFRNQAPRFSKILHLLVRFFFWMIGVNLFLQVLVGDSFTEKVHSICQILLFPALIWLLLSLYKNARFFYHKLILTGTLALVIGFICTVATRQFGSWHDLARDVIRCFHTPWGDFCLYHLRVGIIIDVICFSWALTLRQKALLLEKATPSPPAPIVRVYVSAGEVANPEDPFLRQITDFLENHYLNENLDIHQIAKSVYLSAGQVNRKLKAKTGLTTEQFLLRYRLEQARNKILYTNDSIGQIMMNTGFKDMAHFSRSFKRQFGISPNALRHERETNGKAGNTQEQAG